MQALVCSLSLPRVVLIKTLGRRFPWLVYGPWGPVRLQEVPVPSMPDDQDWALVRPRLAGICGTDIGVLTAAVSPSASPFSSFPCVLGHEVVGEIATAGRAVTLPVGSRVVVDPSIGCDMRGFEPCRHCAAGLPYRCERAAEGRLAPGLILGFCRDLPGGWSQQMLAHRRQLFAVPDAVSDEKAVLVEPLAIGMHAVLRRVPPRGARVLILGAGTIGLCLLAALRMLDLADVDVTITAKHPAQAELADRLGASRVITPGEAARVAEELGARRYRPLIGRPVFRGGFDLVYDCVGSQRTLDDALRLAREGGTVVVVGGAGEVNRLDWTFVWMRELDVVGAAGYGSEHWRGRSQHTFELVLESLCRHPELPLERLITHRFALSEYRHALRGILRRRASSAVKIVLVPNSR